MFIMIELLEDTSTLLFFVKFRKNWKSYEWKVEQTPIFIKN